MRNAVLVVVLALITLRTPSGRHCSPRLHLVWLYQFFQSYQKLTRRTVDDKINKLICDNGCFFISSVSRLSAVVVFDESLRSIFAGH